MEIFKHVPKVGSWFLAKHQPPENKDLLAAEKV